MRYPRQIESHLDTAQGARQHEVVEIPKMADPKYFVLQAAKAGAKRHVEVIQNRFSKGVGRMTGGRAESGYRMTVFLRINGDCLQTPCFSRAPRCLTMPAVARKYIAQSFLGQHLQGFFQSVEQIGGGGIRGKTTCGFGKERGPGPGCPLETPGF